VPLLIPTIAAGLLLPGLISGPSDDAATFTLAGKLILSSEAPYADIWDHKPPGAALFAAAAQILLPFLAAWPSVWVASLVSVAAAAWLTGSLVASEDGPSARPAARLMAIVALAAFPISAGGGLSEPIAALPAVAALLLGARSTTLGPAVASGSLASLACLSSVQAIPVIPAALVAVWLGSNRSRVAIVAWVVGLALPALAVTTWLAAIGALPSAVDAVIAYNLVYVRLPTVISDLQLILQLMALAALALLFLPPAARALVLLRRRAMGSSRQVLLVWGAGTLAMLALQGRPFAQYEAAGLPAIAALAGVGVGMASRRQLRVFRIGWAVAAALGIAATVLELPRDTSHATAAAAAVRSAAEPSGTLFVWGVQPQLYLTSEMTPANRYVYGYPITTPGYWSAAKTRDLVAELRAHPPDVIVDASSPEGSAGFVPLLRPHPVLVDRGRDLDTVDPLREFVTSRYRTGQTIGGYIIYLPAQAP
jgi:hypothetical protein